MSKQFGQFFHDLQQPRPLPELNNNTNNHTCQNSMNENQIIEEYDKLLEEKNLIVRELSEEILKLKSQLEQVESQKGLIFF